MLLTTEDLSTSVDLDLSTEELTWLQASAILGEPPAPPPKDDDIFMQDLSLSSSATLSYVLTPPTPILEDSHGSPRRAESPSTPQRSTTPRTSDSPRSEWIYRRPKSPVAPRHRSVNPNPYPRPSAAYTKQPPPSSTRSGSTASTQTTRTGALASSRASLDRSISTSSATSSSGVPWSTVLRPRSRSERSVPLLKTIPSESQIALTPPGVSSPISTSFSTPKKISAPRSMAARPPSVSSTLSSVSVSTSSPSSSRSESPVTPVSISSSPYGGGSRFTRLQQSPNHHRRHRTLPDGDASLVLLSQSCPPSKSILTRTSSISTKDSSHTVNKSVKFAAIPTVHYASRGYWDLENLDGDEIMGINVDAMDVDDSFSAYRAEHALDVARLRELQCTTPTPEREKAKAMGLKRLMSLSRKPAAPTTGTNTHVATAHKPLPPASPRPFISTPYPLGTSPAQAQAMQSTASLRAAGQSQRSRNGDAGSVSDLLPLQGAPVLRTAPSCESFRSSKSATARSVRSLGSVKSTLSTRGFRAWLGRTVGWTET